MADANIANLTKESNPIHRGRRTEQERAVTCVGLKRHNKVASSLSRAISGIIGIWWKQRGGKKLAQRTLIEQQETTEPSVETQVTSSESCEAPTCGAKRSDVVPQQPISHHSVKEFTHLNRPAGPLDEFGVMIDNMTSMLQNMLTSTQI